MELRRAHTDMQHRHHPEVNSRRPEPVEIFVIWRNIANWFTADEKRTTARSTHASELRNCPVHIVETKRSDRFQTIDVVTDVINHPRVGRLDDVHRQCRIFDEPSHAVRRSADQILYGDTVVVEPLHALGRVECDVLICSVVAESGGPVGIVDQIDERCVELLGAQAIADGSMAQQIAGNEPGEHSRARHACLELRVPNGQHWWQRLTDFRVRIKPIMRRLGMSIYVDDQCAMVNKFRIHLCLPRTLKICLSNTLLDTENSG